MTRLSGVAPLDPALHRTDQFSCGEPSLDRWLVAYGGQAQRRDAARTFVVADEARRVAGYYTLVAGQVEHGATPAPVSAGLSRHFPIPVCVIARLAVTTVWQSKGLGSDLLMDALSRVLGAAEEIGIRAVVVDAISIEAAAFYRRYDFEPATSEGLTLMVPLVAVRRILLRD